jgi:predicted phage terminase large subunit-like protein
VYLSHLLVAQDDIWDKDPTEFDDAQVIIRAGESIDFAQFHEDLFEIVNTKGPSRAREAIIAPRGFAKSTIITIIVLFWAAFQLRQFVLWTSETASQVEELVASLIDELESNDELLEDFPHLKPARDQRGNVVKWTDRDLVMESGFRLSARGRRKATRGLRRGASRPDAVICDDAEGEDSVGETQYPKTRHWITRVIGPAMSPRGDIYWMNTLVDWVSVTGALIRQDEDWTRPWKVTHLEAEWDEYVDEAGVSHRVDPTMPMPEGDYAVQHRLLWPEYWPQERIDGFREEFGELAYMFELRNRPMIEGQKLFRRDWLKWARITISEGGGSQVVLRDDKPSNEWINAGLLTHVTAIDPAFGGKDYAAVVTGAVFNHDFFVREAWWDRGEGIRTEQVREAVRQAERFDSKIIVVESTAAQIMVADETIRQTRIPVRQFKPAKSKIDRALPVAIRASQGHIYFESNVESVRALYEILVRFPSEIADDPVDAFVMMIEGAAELRSKFLVAS